MIIRNKWFVFRGPKRFFFGLLPQEQDGPYRSFNPLRFLWSVRAETGFTPWWPFLDRPAIRFFGHYRRFRFPVFRVWARMG